MLEDSGFKSISKCGRHQQQHALVVGLVAHAPGLANRVSRKHVIFTSTSFCHPAQQLIARSPHHPTIMSSSATILSALVRRLQTGPVWSALE